MVTSTKRRDSTLQKVGDAILDAVIKTDYEQIQVSTKINWVMKILDDNPNACVLLFSSW
jgi:hypothetical protein